MFLRRAFFGWLGPAAVVLPVWLAIGWAVFGGGGWGTLGLVVVVPVTAVALAIVALLVRVRPAVRAEHAASWIDVGVIAAWHASIIGIGFYGASATVFGVLAILLGVAAFWIAVWQLVTDGARRVQATMNEFERLAAQQAGGAGLRPDESSGAPRRRPPFDGDGDGEVIIVPEVRD